MPQQANPWFDPNSPITTFGSGAQSVMQGMYAAAMAKKQQEEQARQFDIQQALESRKQGWTEQNTPAFQFGQMTDITRDKWGQDVPLQDVQENTFRQFAPKYEQTLDEQAQAMVKSGGAKDTAEAYNKLQKVGEYNVYNTPSRQGVPSSDTTKFNKAMSMYDRGEFGPVGSPEALEGMTQFLQGVSIKPTLNVTPPKVLGEHKAVVASAAKNIATTLQTIDGELKAISGKPELYDDEGNLLPMEGGEKKGGFLGIGGKVQQWPALWAGKFKLLKEHRAKYDAAMKFVQYIQDKVEGGSTLTTNVVNWINQINNYPQALLEDDTVLQAIPNLQKEMEMPVASGPVR